MALDKGCRLHQSGFSLPPVCVSTQPSLIIKRILVLSRLTQGDCEPNHAIIVTFGAAANLSCLSW